VGVRPPLGTNSFLSMSFPSIAFIPNRGPVFHGIDEVLPDFRLRSMHNPEKKDSHAASFSNPSA